MTKTELITKTAEKTGLSNTDTTRTVETVLQVIAESLRSGENVNLKEFGNFQIIARKERKARNLKTNEMIVVPAKEVVKFKPSNKLF